MIGMMLVLLFVLLLLGVPVCFALAIPTVIYFFLNNATVPVEFMAHETTTPLLNYVLIALPAFLLSGRMMNGTGVTNRLFNLARAWVGRFRGGLIYTNIVSSMMFASMSGTAVGDAGGLGQVEMQMMDKAGYKRDVSAGITAASSVLGPVIPPSVNMVILGAICSISIGKLFMGGIIPGLVMVLALVANIAFRSCFTEEGRSWPVDKVPFKEVITASLQGILPILCPIIIIGGISFGVVTPTEAAVVAIDYAICLGVFYHEVSFKLIWETLEDTVGTAGTFMYIISIAGFYTWIMTREGLPQLLQAVLEPVVGFSQTAALLAIAVFLLVLGCFLDVTAVILMVGPILIPIVNALGIDPVVFGIVMIVTTIIGIITPPFGICLFVISDVAKVPVKAVMKEAVRYLPAMLVADLLIIFFPELITVLPNLIFK
jgi:tripartite ATP-independent transporter DctM subunit